MTGSAAGAAGAPDAAGASPAPEAPGGTLYVVSTPIGHLGDVTGRALEVLRDVPLIAAEDTRITARLLARYAISTPMTSFHARSGPARRAALLDHLRGGADLALVSDAGTPTVSDPGADLVAAWAAVDGRVVPVPGPSALLAALVASGVAGPRWTFEGFLPRSGRERRVRLAAIAADPRASVVYEAPARVAATLRDLVAAGAGERPAAVCRELTKVHESILRGSVASLARAAADGTIPARGEFVLVVGQAVASVDGSSEAAGAAHGTLPGAASPDRTTVGETDPVLVAAQERVEALVAGGVARGEAARRVAAETGLPRRRLYGAERAS